jgi:hypothetical protein
MWIHGYDHLVGNQQSKGYGRFMLREIEADARASGCDGLVVWAKDFDAWNPISFYEHMGFERVDQDNLDVLAWKPFTPTAERPSFLRRNTLIASERPDDGRVQVTVFSNGWCGGGCQLCVMTGDAVVGLENEVDFEEVSAWDKDDMRARGESVDMLYVEGTPFRPDGPPVSEEELRSMLSGRYRQKQEESGSS